MKEQLDTPEANILTKIMYNGSMRDFKVKSDGTQPSDGHDVTVRLKC